MLADLGLDRGPGRADDRRCPAGRRPGSALAALLLSRFDVVLLDEPTNDLDLDGLERLEAFVRGLRGGVVLVSHDREFLARCVTRVVELDLAQHRVAVYDGGYDAYLEERAVARRHAREAYEEFADKKADLVARARTQREWSSQGVRNAMRRAPTTTRSGARRSASPRRSRRRRCGRWSPGSPASRRSRSRARSGCCSSASAPRRARAPSSRPSTTPPLRLGDFAFGPVSLQVNARDRIGITGPNGAGKTTLLRLLLGRLAPGRPAAPAWAPRWRSARSTRPAPALAEDCRSATPSRPSCRELAPADVRTLLAKFGLRADQVTSLVARLSPGERTRAALALLQARGVNLLVLDEPTNHLDLPAIEQLEQALDGVRRRAAAGLPRPPAAGQRAPRPALARRGRDRLRGPAVAAPQAPTRRARAAWASSTVS